MRITKAQDVRCLSASQVARIDRHRTTSGYYERPGHPDQVMRVYRYSPIFGSWRYSIIHYINLRRITLGFSLVLPLVLGLDA